jgi:hypothetical protein
LFVSLKKWILVGGGGEMLTDGKKQRYWTWEIKNIMKTLKAARFEDTREAILPESLNVSIF